MMHRRQRPALLSNYYAPASDIPCTNATATRIIESRLPLHRCPLAESDGACINSPSSTSPSSLTVDLSEATLLFNDKVPKGPVKTPWRCGDRRLLRRLYGHIRRRWYLRYSLAVIVLAIAIIAFGTIYSDLTARDPCAVQREMTRAGPLHMPRYLHYQSKTSEMTEEIRTWQRGLNVIDTTSLEYPGVVLAEGNGWTTVYWSDESCRRLVEEEFPTFADTYHKYFHTIQRVDSCRYLILSKYGGIYADTDVSLHTVNVEELERLIPDGVSLVESPFRYNEMWQNSLMTATIPGHPFWDVVISIMMERGGSDRVLSSTGPKMIGDAVERYNRRRDLKESERLGKPQEPSTAESAPGGSDNDGESSVKTLPCELFQRLPTGEWETTFLNVLGRDVPARAIPMRGCGRYGDGRCEITRHGGKASWTTESGKII